MAKVFSPLDTMPGSGSYWWLNGAGEVHEDVIKVVDTLRNEQAYLERRYRKAIELYENIDVGNLDAWRFATETDVDGPYQYNLVESIADTIHAEIISNKTKPQFITDGVDWIAQEKAEDLTRFISGVFYEARVHGYVSPDVCRDAIVFGTGIAKVFEDEASGRVMATRVFPYDVLVDDIEAASGEPRQMFHVAYVARELLSSAYRDNPAAVEAIAAAESHTFPSMGARVVTDILKVYEAWHLPTGTDPGRHVIAIDGADLLDEKWDKPTFPFRFLRYKRRTK